LNEILELKNIQQEKLTVLKDGPEEILPAKWPNEGRIKFDKVSVRCRPQTSLNLDKLSFEIEPGHKVGILRKAGTGKSAIPLVLSRIFELTEGQILIDGKQISRVNLQKLR
jgi:ABC-type multidrug transport system fused ATPase/permease subunit